MLLPEAGQIATVLVAFAATEGSPSQISVGNEISVPPPATELMAPARNAEPNATAPWDRSKAVNFQRILIDMKLARYWTRQTGEAIAPDGSRIQATARGWSNDSVAAAADVAREIARRVAQRLVTNPGERKQYGYGDRPLPEPIIREFADGGNPAAVVTRNAYGALVLNTHDLMFVDIDREDKATPAAAAQDLVSSVMSLFGKSMPAAPTPAPADTVVAGIQRVATSHNLGGRIYKTASGYRALITSPAFEAGAGATENLLSEFGSDALYVRLCRMQQSFRARLTPKPWRCNMGTPPAEFPFENPRDESRFREWEAKYNAAIARYATCRFVSSFGSPGMEPAFEALVQYHDQETKATSGLPLA